MKQQKETQKIFDSASREDFEKMKNKMKHGILSVQAETILSVDQSVIDAIKEAVIYKQTKRGSLIFLDNFRLENGLFKFNISAPIHRSFADVYSEIESADIIATSFVDFCWMISDGTTAKNAIEVDTPFRDKANLGDLTQVLPSKFADDLIEAMHSLNIDFFEGILSDTNLYGPYFFYKDKDNNAVE